MPNLADHHSNDYTKLLIEGDSGSGKTGALTSLVKAGYRLFILDYDNGLETLKQFVLKECPDKLHNVEYITLRDKTKAGPQGPILDGSPKAYIQGHKLMERWKYDDVDLGNPAEFGPDCIVVLDSLTRFSDAAYDFHDALIRSTSRGAVDKRQIYGAAQDGVEAWLALATSDNFRTNLIVISHIRYMERQDGITKGYPKSVGSALSPNIPTYFNSVAQFETSAGGKRTLKTQATALLDLKNPAPFSMQKEYPIETGLADFFKVLRDHPQQEPKTQLRKV